MRLAEGLARTPAYSLLRPLIARLPAPRQDIQRIAVEVEARSVDGKTRRASLTAPGAYWFTSVAAAQAAAWAAAPGFDRAGPLSPAQAFPPIDFLDGLVGFGAAYRVRTARDLGTTSRKVRQGSLVANDHAGLGKQPLRSPPGPRPQFGEDPGAVRAEPRSEPRPAAASIERHRAAHVPAVGQLPRPRCTTPAGEQSAPGSARASARLFTRSQEALRPIRAGGDPVRGGLRRRAGCPGDRAAHRGRSAGRSSSGRRSRPSDGSSSALTSRAHIGSLPTKIATCPSLVAKVCAGTIDGCAPLG